MRALDIPLGEDRLVIEVRASSGTLDHKLKGVHAYRVPKGDYTRSVLIDTTKADHHPDATDPAPDADALTAGSALVDPTAKVEVKVLATDPKSGTARVSVSLDGVPAPSQAPTAAPTSAPTATPTSTTTATAPPSVKTPRPSADVPGSRSPHTGTESAGTGSLAVTGAGATLWPLAAAGTALAALGAAFLLRARRRAASAGGRHAGR
ncbi:hypothetical protein OG730_04335 [Streptomyces sp. NBC_01298]|uniref:hypothetical protein n=1 Tax=Streptomyces sp. NBC_01298 TaxID=2903817 RepID=UPI002E0EDADE|nr:hypothetical protein OG730_04335 [Streptomyces sp. NBC_01298]